MGSLAAPELHGYVLCDDCEKLWLSPEIGTEQRCQPDVTPTCPLCHAAVYGQHARWASESDVIELGWREQCVVEPMCAAGDEDLLDPEDFATDLDSPEPPELHDQGSHGHLPSPAEQLADVTPQLDEPDEDNEPKPGC